MQLKSDDCKSGVGKKFKADLAEGSSRIKYERRNKIQ